MSNKSSSRSYQDYVFKSGKFVGQFEEMYRDSVEVPWHQDKTANAIFSDMCVTILRHCEPTSLLDVGCGLGYMAERFRREVPGLSNVVGMDISATAAAEAAKMFPAIRFLAGDMKSVRLDETFDVVVSKDVLWYVVDDLGGYIHALAARSNKWIYIGQSFPETRPYYGEQQLPDAQALFDTLRKLGLEITYQLVERDARYGNREYAHALLKTRQSGIGDDVPNDVGQSTRSLGQIPK